MLRLLILQIFIISTRCQLEPKHLLLNKDAYLLTKDKMCIYVDDCEDTEKVYICASNGKTYDSRCAFRKAACKIGSNIEFSHTGKCTVKEICLGQRNTALKDAKNQKGVFIPVCNPDGTYAALQCHDDTGYCWCSSSSGRPIGIAKLKIKGSLDCSSLPGLPARRNENGKPSYRPKGGMQPDIDLPTPEVLEECNPFNSYPCPKPHRLENVDKSAAKYISPEVVVPQAVSNNSTVIKKRKRPRGCTGKRRLKFNKKMISNMVRDFKRESYRQRLMSSVEVGTLQWKFLQMDVNTDGQLNRKEYRTLQKIVKRNMKPRRCARKFPGFCDINGDNKISIKEWISCFTSSGKENKIETNETDRQTHLFKLGISDIKRREPCFRDRDQAMESSKNGQNQLFVPACNKEGYYRPVQCYGSTGKKLWYCFCVHVKTGVMIENTSIKNGTPNCSASKRWPRCPPPKKEEIFLTALLSYFAQQSNSVKSPLKVLGDVPKAKQAIKIIFNKFDQNKNSFIEKKEIKRLRKFIRKNRKLKKCGGKIHLVCDVDEDRKLSEKELIECVLPKREPENNSVVHTRKDKKLKGKNPFVHIIKAE